MRELPTRVPKGSRGSPSTKSRTRTRQRRSNLSLPQGRRAGGMGVRPKRKHPRHADRRHPILQSYLDIILRGCMSVSQEFARGFLESTRGWWHDGNCNIEGGAMSEEVSVGEASSDRERSSEQNLHHTWVNDRSDPMYVRADRGYSNEMGGEIDALIGEHYPRALQRRSVSM